MALLHLLPMHVSDNMLFLVRFLSQMQQHLQHYLKSNYRSHLCQPQYLDWDPPDLGEDGGGQTSSTQAVTASGEEMAAAAQTADLDAGAAAVAAVAPAVEASSVSGTDAASSTHRGPGRPGRHRSPSMGNKPAPTKIAQVLTEKSDMILICCTDLLCFVTCLSKSCVSMFFWLYSAVTRPLFCCWSVRRFDFE